MHLACVNLRMTMEESLVAATINAAASLGRAHSHGSLEPGKVADMLVIDAPRYMGLVRGGGGQKFHVIEGPNSFDHLIILRSVSHSLLVEVQKNAGYIGAMHA